MGRFVHGRVWRRRDSLFAQPTGMAGAGTRRQYIQWTPFVGSVLNHINSQLEERTMAIAIDRATALGQTTNDLGQAGIIFNDAVRLSNGGLWSQPADNNNQLNYASQYEADIGILKTDIASAIAIGATVNGVSVTPSSAN